MSLDQVTIKELLIGIIVVLVFIFFGITHELKRIREILELKEHLWKKQRQRHFEEELERI